MPKMADNLILLLCFLLAAVCSCSAIFCNPCDSEQCPEAVNCTAGTVLDTCQCCQVCAIPYGEPCKTEDIGLCADGNFCLPDGGLFSGSLTGKCLGKELIMLFFSVCYAIILYQLRLHTLC